MSEKDRIIHQQCQQIKLSARSIILTCHSSLKILRISAEPDFFNIRDHIRHNAQGECKYRAHRHSILKIIAESCLNLVELDLETIHKLCSVDGSYIARLRKLERVRLRLDTRGGQFHCKSSFNLIRFLGYFFEPITTAWSNRPPKKYETITPVCPEQKFKAFDLLLGCNRDVCLDSPDFPKTNNHHFRILYNFFNQKMHETDTELLLLHHWGINDELLNFIFQKYHKSLKHISVSHNNLISDQPFYSIVRKYHQGQKSKNLAKQRKYKNGLPLEKIILYGCEKLKLSCRYEFGWLRAKYIRSCLPKIRWITLPVVDNRLWHEQSGYFSVDEMMKIESFRPNFREIESWVEFE